MHHGRSKRSYLMTAISSHIAGDWRPFIFGSPVVSDEVSDARPLTNLVSRAYDEMLYKIADTQRSSEPPTEGAIDLASRWLPTLLNRAAKIGGWESPHVSSTASRELAYEWWHKERKLTIYFSDGGAELIEVWGTDIDNEMRSEELSNWTFSSAWLTLRA
jgi:hypothetical protein